ncbi:MAG: glucosamine-6-phosphate deaminase [Chloroflexota bacterium]
MQVIIADDYEDVSRRAAGVLADVALARPDAVVSLATGETPLGMYRVLIGWVESGRVDLSHMRFFMLDDYLGAGQDDQHSFYRWLREAIFDPAGVPPAHVQVLPTLADEGTLEESCLAYEAAIKGAGGIDLQLLGIGSNGHLGFNEPLSPRDSRTRIVDLTEKTVESNARYWGPDVVVPRRAITMGLGTILEARQQLLLASGAAKAEILARALEGPVTEEVPASLLQEAPSALIIADRAAAARLHRTPISL